MKKKLLAVFMTFAMTLSLMPTAMAEEGNETTGNCLPEAIDGVITLKEDVTLDAPYTVAEDTTVTIDLSGFELSYNSTTQGEAMITNKGTLTINDSSTEKTGVINYNYTGAADSSYGKGNYTISNGGTLTVNGGKITIADLRAHAKYPIDNNSTGGDAVLVINGGHLYNYNTSAIRQFCNSTTNENSVTINGGLIEGYCAIWIQNPGSKTVNGKLSITGGEIKTTAAAYVNGTAELEAVSSAIYCTIAGEGGAWSADSSVSLTGGIFNENVSLIEDAPMATAGEGATFNGYLEIPAPPVAQIGETPYASLASAVAAAQAGDIVTLLNNVALEDEVLVIPAGADMTLDTNGKTLSGKATNASASCLIEVKSGAKLTLTGNGKVAFAATKPDTEWGEGMVSEFPGYASNTIKNSGTLTIDGPAVENQTGRGGASYVIDNYTGADLTVESGTITQSGGDIAIRLFAGSETKPIDVTVNGGTITGRRAIWIQLAGSDNNVAPAVHVNVTGGKLLSSDDAEGGYNMAIYSYTYGNSFANTKVNISGGELEDVAFTGGSLKTPTETVSVTGGSFTAVYSYGDMKNYISGGTFGNDPTASLTDGYIAMKDGASYKVVVKGNLTAGTYMADPTGATADNHYVTNNNDGTWTVVYRAPSSGGNSGGSSSSSGNTTTSTEKNPDGSTTTTTTNKTTGAVTETTKNPDGTTGVTKTDADGNVTEVSANVPAAAAKAADKADEPVTLPIEVKAADSSAEATEIKVNVPSAGATVEIPVENVTPGTVVVVVNADGTETIMPVTTLTEDGVVVTLEDDATIKVIDNSKEFTDVADDYALADSIDFVSARGLFEGNTETTFNPHANTTIAQTMTVLARLSGEDFYGAGSTAKGAEWATEKGLSDGTDVNKAVTREQMVVMMWKLAGMPESDHPLAASDVNDISADALTAMQWAVEMGILKGNLDGTINPQGNASRAHVAAFTERYVNAIA